MTSESVWFRAWVANAVHAVSGASECKALPAEPVVSVVQEDGDAIKSSAYVCGVYFLYLADELQYIGQSGNVYARLAQHMAMAPFEFDRFVIEACSASSLRENEAKAIHKHSPRWNKEIPAYGGKKHSRR